MSTAAAYHEAGHFVVAQRHGVDIASITIEPTGRGSVRTARKLGAHEPQDLLVAILSGPAAETKFRGSPSSLDSRDREQAVTLASVVARADLDSPATAATLERFEARAAAEVLANWNQIERVAGALSRRGTLHANDLADVVTRGGENAMRTNERQFERE